MTRWCVQTFSNKLQNMHTFIIYTYTHTYIHTNKTQVTIAWWIYHWICDWGISAKVKFCCVTAQAIRGKEWCFFDVLWSIHRSKQTKKTQKKHKNAQKMTRNFTQHTYSILQMIAIVLAQEATILNVISIVLRYKPNCIVFFFAYFYCYRWEKTNNPKQKTKTPKKSKNKKKHKYDISCK